MVYMDYLIALILPGCWRDGSNNQRSSLYSLYIFVHYVHYVLSTRDAKSSRLEVSSYTVL